MRKLLPALILMASLLACNDTVQNSDKQKDMTRGNSPSNSMTATDQQNYGAANQGSNQNDKDQKDPSHTENLTNPAPAPPTPEAKQKK